MKNIFETDSEFYQRTGIMSPEKAEAARKEWDEHMAEVRKQYKGKKRAASRKAAKINVPEQ